MRNSLNIIGASIVLLLNTQGAAQAQDEEYNEAEIFFNQDFEFQDQPPQIQTFYSNFTVELDGDIVFNAPNQYRWQSIDHVIRLQENGSLTHNFLWESSFYYRGTTNGIGFLYYFYDSQNSIVTEMSEGFYVRCAGPHKIPGVIRIDADEIERFSDIRSVRVVARLSRDIVRGC